MSRPGPPLPLVEPRQGRRFSLAQDREHGRPDLAWRTSRRCDLGDVGVQLAHDLPDDGRDGWGRARDSDPAAPRFPDAGTAIFAGRGTARLAVNLLVEEAPHVNAPSISLTRS